MEYNYYSKIFKVLSDDNRLKILDLVSSKDACACHILKEFDITQPTFTHHIKVLRECGLITTQKVGTKINNTINIEKLNEIKNFIDYLLNAKKCVCENECRCKASEMNKNE